MSYLETFRTRQAFGQILRVALIGGVNTVVYFVLLNLLLVPIGRFWAITSSFGFAVGVSYVLNRRYSFRISDGSVGTTRETAAFFVVNIATWALTVGVLEAADALWGPLQRLQVNVVALVTAAFIVIPKFAMYRDVVFKRSLEASS